MDDSGAEAIEAAVDGLYAGSLEDFTTARNGLARRLRAMDRRADAETVAKLRKPSLAAWTVNQLVRRHRDEVEALAGVASELREAQTQVSAGGGRDRLRNLAVRRRDLVSALVERAAAILAEEGVSAPRPHLERVTATLMAAGEDDAVSREVQRGRLSEHLTPGGFAAFAASLPAEVPTEPAQREASEAERLRALIRDARDADADARRLEDEAVAAAARAERARAAADEAETVAHRAREAAAGARRRADELRALVEQEAGSAGG